MAERDREEFIYGKYGQGYSTSTEVIREQEYPNLNSMSPSLIPFHPPVLTIILSGIQRQFILIMLVQLSMPSH